MQARKRFQKRITRILANQILRVEGAKAGLPETKKELVSLRAGLEDKYNCCFRPEARGATWLSYQRGNRDMAWPLIRRLVVAYREIPTRKMSRDEELARDKLLKILMAFERAHPEHDYLLEPDFIRRLRRVSRDLTALKQEALTSLSDIKQTAILDVLEPVVDELGG